MKKVALATLLSFFIAAVAVIAFPSTVHAADYACNISLLGSTGGDGVYNLPSEKVEVSSTDVRSLGGEPVNNSDGTFFLDLGVLDRGAGLPIPVSISNGSFGPINLDSKIIETIRNSPNPETFEIKLMRNTGALQVLNRELVCRTTFKSSNTGGAIANSQYSCGSPGIGLTRTGSEIVNVAISVDGASLPTDRSYFAYFRKAGVAGDIAAVPLSPSSGDYAGGFSGNLEDGTYTLVIADRQKQILPDLLDLRVLAPSDISGCITSFSFNKTSLEECNEPGKCFVPPGSKPGVTVPFDICTQVHTADQRRCNICLCGEDNCKGKTIVPEKIKIWTSIGCIPASKQGIVESLLRVGLGLSGGVLVIMILAGAFNLATSAGETKKVQEAQEMISAAIMGLLFVIFSVIILRFIVINVLHIPGFGS
jgi:hypothetical protein